jgi:nicotinamidase/pyrazinamidase
MITPYTSIATSRIRLEDIVKALLLIDLQNDFMPHGTLPVPDGFAAVEAANMVQKFFRTVIATKDWHPERHLSFAVHHPGMQPGDVIDLHGLKQTLWPMHCVQNTQGAAFSKALNQSQIQHVVTKGQDINVDSYSAFFDNARRHPTGLSSYLKLRAIDEIFYLLGVATEYCVKYSALDALYLGLKTNVIIDGCRGIGLREKDIENAENEMQDAGVRLIKMADLANERS